MRLKFLSPAGLVPRSKKATTQIVQSLPNTMSRILVIDDDSVVRELTGRILERHGHKVDMAADGNTGVTAFRANPPDLVITDMAMPGKDGVEVIAALTKDFPDIPVIAMSCAPDSAQYLYLASFLGAERMLTKPFSPEVLMATVDAVVARPK